MKQKHILTAFIYDKRGKVLSVGQNNYVKTHPMQAHYAKKVGQPERAFLHAEIHAIVKCKDLSKADKIFITRYDSNGNPRLAKPCPICYSAIKSAGIKKIEYTIG